MRYFYEINSERFPHQVSNARWTNSTSTCEVSQKSLNILATVTEEDDASRTRDDLLKLIKNS